MKKKSIALILAVLTVVMCFVFAACGGTGNKETTAPAGDETTVATADSDLDYIKNKGKLVIGYTIFAPMNYEDENGDLIGFETEFAKAVCKELGVEADFQLISWAAKETELKSKNIDCIWNGMTIDADRKAAMEITNAYMKNKQVLVVKAENADKYLTADALDGVAIVAEQKSAGETVATTEAIFAKAAFTAVKDQATALKEVKSGVSQGAVVDYVTSIGMIGEGTSYEDLVVVDELVFQEEEYGIAFRKGSDATAKVNEIISKLAANGELKKIAEKYELAEQLIAK